LRQIFDSFKVSRFLANTWKDLYSETDRVHLDGPKEFGPYMAVSVMTCNGTLTTIE